MLTIQNYLLSILNSVNKIIPIKIYTHIIWVILQSTFKAAESMYIEFELTHTEFAM